MKRYIMYSASCSCGRTYAKTKVVAAIGALKEKNDD